MERCRDCTHHDACDMWAHALFSQDTIFPYEAEIHLCEHYDPVKHGEWKKHNGYKECSVCGVLCEIPSNYCPDCGVYMEETINE